MGIGPVGSLSWENVPDVEKEVVQRLIPFLEDRRVLYSPSEVEVPHHCVDSILQIRELVVAQAGLLPADSELRATLRCLGLRLVDFQPVARRTACAIRLLSPGSGSAVQAHLARISHEHPAPST